MARKEHDAIGLFEASGSRPAQTRALGDRVGDADAAKRVPRRASRPVSKCQVPTKVLIEGSDSLERRPQQRERLGTRERHIRRGRHHRAGPGPHIQQVALLATKPVLVAVLQARAAERHPLGPRRGSKPGDRLAGQLDAPRDEHNHIGLRRRHGLVPEVRRSAARRSMYRPRRRHSLAVLGTLIWSHQHGDALLQQCRVPLQFQLRLRWQIPQHDVDVADDGRGGRSGDEDCSRAGAYAGACVGEQLLQAGDTRQRLGPVWWVLASACQLVQHTQRLLRQISELPVALCELGSQVGNRVPARRLAGRRRWFWAVGHCGTIRVRCGTSHGGWVSGHDLPPHRVRPSQIFCQRRRSEYLGRSIGEQSDGGGPNVEAGHGGAGWASATRGRGWASSIL